MWLAQRTKQSMIRGSAIYSALRFYYLKRPIAPLVAKNIKEHIVYVCVYAYQWYMYMNATSLYVILWIELFNRCAGIIEAYQ